MKCNLCGDYIQFAIAVRTERSPGYRPHDENYCGSCFIQWIRAKEEVLEAGGLS